MTASVESIIAEVLGRHKIQIATDDGDRWSPPEEDCTCSCGEEIGGWVACGPDWEWPDWDKAHAAHQAAAVMAALTEAGGVEYAVAVGNLSYKFQAQELELAKQFANIHEGQLNSRIKAGPWQEVAG